MRIRFAKSHEFYVRWNFCLHSGMAELGYTRSSKIFSLQQPRADWPRYVADSPNSARGFNIPNTLKLQSTLWHDADRQLDYVYPRLWQNKHCILLKQCDLCFVRFSQETTIISLNNKNWMVFVTEMVCFFRNVATAIGMNFRLQRDDSWQQVGSHSTSPCIES
jgi:hypothetical protein